MQCGMIQCRSDIHLWDFILVFPYNIVFTIKADTVSLTILNLIGIDCTKLFWGGKG